MSGRYLLDTNIIIALFADDQSVVSKLEIADKVFVPSIAIGELYYGAQKSKQKHENSDRILEFSSSSIVLDVNIGTARHYGQIKADLRTRGKPIPENDIWIAAISSQYRLILVTRDQHFSHLRYLTIENW